MGDIHCDKSIELLRQKVKTADDSLHDALALVETVSAQQKDINSINQKLKESDQKNVIFKEQLDKCVSARALQSKEIKMLQDKIKGSKDECQRLKDLIYIEQQKAREFEKSVRALESSNVEIIKYIEYKDLKIQHLECDAKQNEQKIEMLENVLDNQKSKLNESRTELENSQRKMGAWSAKSNLSRSPNEQLKLFERRQLQEKEEMLAVQKKLLLEKEKERKTTTDVEVLKELRKMKTEKDDVITKMKEMEKEKDVVLAKKAKEIRYLEKEKDELLCRERKLKKDGEELKQELTKMKTEKDDITTKMNEMEKEKDAIVAKKAKEIRNLEKEKDELLCRLSPMAGSRLTDKNPNIADLSDLSRPTKLAEKYSELYDNEWTDAFSYLQAIGAFEGPEADIIAVLVSMLTKAYTVSLNTAMTQLNTLRKTLNDFHGNTLEQSQKINDVINQLKNNRKKAIYPRKELTEEYRNELEESFRFLHPSSFDSDALSCYLKKCLELCWLMTIQDPPVYILYEGCKKGDRFDNNLYKEYTQSGRFILYIVWPALLLEKDGVLLCKGVVQCEKRKLGSLGISKVSVQDNEKGRPWSLYGKSKTPSMPPTAFQPGDKANKGIPNSTRNAETNKSKLDQSEEPEILISEML